MIFIDLLPYLLAALSLCLLPSLCNMGPATLKMEDDHEAFRYALALAASAAARSFDPAPAPRTYNPPPKSDYVPFGDRTPWYKKDT